MRARLLTILLLAATPALAQVPGAGEGTISLQAGVRTIPNRSFVRDELSKGPASHAQLHPGALLAFGFKPDEEFHVALQFGYGSDRYALSTGDLKVRSFQILLYLDTALWQRPWVTVYGGGGLGYSLNTFDERGRALESNSTAGFLAVGARFKLTKKLALVVEDRYVLSSAQRDVGAATLNVGGNLFTVGLMLHFFQEDDRMTKTP